eukprot:TRINITY_DN30770_c0_g1_i1.p1 TRINITY_DN30770_c0_g1~~TRINITY_DN30770_c0_g1_i1.p1  ORF type:complete len:439 (+),score=87.19 TRINITY_DN30770_c0_g1_i1:28-1344(+)
MNGVCELVGVVCESPGSDKNEVEGHDENADVEEKVVSRDPDSNNNQEEESLTPELEAKESFVKFSRNMGLFFWMLWSAFDALSLCTFPSNTAGYFEMLGESRFGYCLSAILCFASSPLPWSDEFWPTFCVVFVPMFYPLIAFVAFPDVLQQAVILYVKGILLLAASRMMTDLFARYGLPVSVKGSPTSARRQRLVELADDMVVQGYGLSIVLVLVVCKSMLPFLFESLVERECRHGLKASEPGKWTNLQTIDVKSAEDPICYVHYREFEMGLVELAIIQNFVLANVVYHAVSNKGFLKLPSRVFELSQVDFKENRCATTLHVLTHVLLLLSWIGQIALLTWASINPNAFHYRYSNYTSLFSFGLGSCLILFFYNWKSVYYYCLSKPNQPDDPKNPDDGYMRINDGSLLTVPFCVPFGVHDELAGYTNLKTEVHLRIPH